MAITSGDISWLLSDIRDKVRKLTGRPSTNQISNDRVDEYINRFLTQDLVALLDIRQISSIWNFSTVANLERYSNEHENVALESYARVNGGLTPVYTDPKQFYDAHPPQWKELESIGTGDGSTTAFSGTLDKSVINLNNIVISDGYEVFLPQDLPKVTGITSADPAVVTTEKAHGLTTGDEVKIIDIDIGMTQIENRVSEITVPTSTTFQLDDIDSSNFTTYQGGGYVFSVENIVLKSQHDGSGTVTASTGAYSITFENAPEDGANITASYEFSNTGRPVAILYYDDELLLTPTPNDSYFVQIPVSGRPIPLLADTDALPDPDLGKLVAYGASLDLLNDAGQQEEARLIEPQFQRLISQYRYLNIRNDSEQQSIPRF